MPTVIGDILPLAIGIAVSPIPIIAAILMLLSPRAKTTGVGFMVGWILGILIAVTVFGLLSSVLPSGGADGSSPWKGVLHIVLGAVLVVLAVRRFRSRPRHGEEPALPKWMSAIDAMTAPKALGLGFVLAAVNPKNLLLAASAGATIGGSGLDAGATAVVIAVFTLIAASSVAIPVVSSLVASRQMAKPLGSLRLWLVENNATIMAVVLLVMGFVVIGKGISGF